MIEIDAGLIAVFALQVRGLAGGAEGIAAAVEGVEGLVAGAEGAGVEVDGVRGRVHFGAGVGQEAGPAGSVVVVHFAGAVRLGGGRVRALGRKGLWGEEWWTYQSELRYSLALVRVRASRPGAARVLVAPVRRVRVRARASLLMVGTMVDCGDGFRET